MTELPDRSSRPDPQPSSYPSPSPSFPPYQPGSFQPYPYPPGPYPGSYPPPPPSAGDYPGELPAPKNGLTIAALVVGIIGLLSAISVVGGLILGTAAVIMGVVARGRAKRGAATNGGVALSAVVVGVLAIIAGLVSVAFWVGLFNEVGAGDYLDCLRHAGQDRTMVEECSDRFRASVEDRFPVTPTP